MEKLLIPNKIIRTKRKSLSLIINNHGELIVRAPLKYKDSQIFDFINKKAKWIITKRTNTNILKYKPLTFEGNETINLLGETYEICLFSNRSAKLVGNKLFVPNIDSKERLIAFLKRMAKKYMTEKVAEIAKNYNFKYKSVSISSAKTNWGSCSFQNRLHFTYKLMMCPIDIINYIIVHELAHTVVKNHSSKYWETVADIYPNYKTCEKWLKENKGIVEII